MKSSRSKMEDLCVAPSRLSAIVRELGYSGSPLPLDEWWRLRQTILSMSKARGLKRVNLPPAIVSCAQCGEMMVRQACEIRKHFQRGHEHFYCSTECWGRATNVKRHGERTCGRCGGPAPRRSSVGSAERGRIFCSRACLEAERQEEFEQRALARMKPCERCNAMFMPANPNIRFCSTACASRAHAGRMRGDGNPRWKNGATASRVKPHVTRRFREMRPLVMRRDGHRCVLCEHSEGLEVHHIDENPLNNRAVNLVTLCPPCHRKVHFSDEKEMLSSQLKTLAEQPMSTTFRWAERTASSRTESSSTTVS